MTSVTPDVEGMTMLRQTMAGSVAAVLLAPALLVGGTTPAHAASRHDWGRIAAPDGVLRKGCQGQRYRYRLQPPPGDWALELFLVGPRGRRLGSAVHLAGQDPTVGTGRFTICRAVTTYGRFRIRGRLSVQNGPQEYVEGWIKPAAFTLRRR